MVLVVGLLGLQMEIGAPLMAGWHFLKLQSGVFLDIKNYCHGMGLYLSSVFIYCLLGWGGASLPSSLHTFIQQMSVRTPQCDVGVQSVRTCFPPQMPASLALHLDFLLDPQDSLTRRCSYHAQAADREMGAAVFFFFFFL